jgi:hypothetical protein
MRTAWSSAAVLALLLASPASPPAAASSTASHLIGSAPALAAPGVPFTFTVTALDNFENPDPSYDGTLHFESSDASATLPADTHMTGASASFTVTLSSLGTQTIAAVDTFSGRPFVATASIAVTRVATQLELVGPASTVVGLPALVTMRALDPSGELVTGYAGTVHFSSSDAHATLPADVKLVKGQASVLATFATPGSQTISAADTTAAAIAGRSAPVVVGFVPLPPPPPGDGNGQPPDDGTPPPDEGTVPPPGGGVAPPAPAAPTVRGLAVKPLCVRKAALLSVPRTGRGALGVSFSLSAGAQVSVGVARLVHAKALARCPKRAGSTAGAVKVVKSFGGTAPGGRNAFAVAAAAGRRTVPLAGSAAAKALAPGAYLVQVRATDAAGRRSALATAKFFVLR